MSVAIPEPFVWDSSFDVKHDELNTQHKKLFQLIKDLSEDMGNADKLKALIDMVAVHFKLEEDLMKKVNFADHDPHKAKHDKFVADVKALKAVDDAAIKFAKNWLVNHIKGTDMLYVGKI